MKFLTAAASFLVVQSCAAFAPVAPKASFGVVSSRGNVAVNMADGKVPFFADQGAAAETSEADLSDMTLEDEVESMVQAEMKKTKKISNLRNANGVDYAPWMNISAEDEDKIRQLMKEKAEARRRRQEQEKSVSGNLYYDSQAQELSGTGLNYKIIGGEVELEWATKSERDTKGFIVKRRPAKTEEFDTIASFEEWGPLQSKGVDGGIYRYLDSTVSPGGWVYRVSECDNFGTESDLCQCLVEVQTEDEQRAAVIAAVGIVAIGIAAVVAGLALDPYAG
mmetsp:Transcript_26193/g.53659  ORF Transcript_26193/g.53659 Transcript_26193/m.53659 type:complete len:279 (-) Transcript_26193:408-1244(-)|eukprot:CAMPEP_0183294280 /NCGR_PEP_ID=MMETSP0160_2-20130417/2676_1 /TAXON_ID=2839 ORGANISM="Odontella Sinensis, Strain Grunow 1884" /NCGR_SAMPLE_ID=MMETSP0160_2 /ASSEMBLY_ACC=CAM_ASM_000250 /LENGTH=278 /DNA_ID=CAMNT_0025455579 /DNA_START=99 /DNA_END=935 /DNA_ORIENTATION=+